MVLVFRAGWVRITESEYTNLKRIELRKKEKKTGPEKRERNSVKVKK